MECYERAKGVPRWERREFLRTHHPLHEHDSASVLHVSGASTAASRVSTRAPAPNVAESVSAVSRLSPSEPTVNALVEIAEEAGANGRALELDGAAANTPEVEARAPRDPVDAANAAQKRRPAGRLARRVTLSRHPTLILHEDCASRTTEGGYRRHLCPRTS